MSKSRTNGHDSPDASQENPEPGGLRIQAHFVAVDEDPYLQVKWAVRTSQINGSHGEVVSAFEDVEVPEAWSQLATDIVASKYFRKAGVPKTGREKSVRQVVLRIVQSIVRAAEEQGGYFRAPQDARQFGKELTHILLQQKAAFNSPVWFNCGLYQQYGIGGSGGTWAWDAGRQAVLEIDQVYTRPPCSACFIQSVDDDLMKIFDLVKNEARIFKYGSGTGTNFSKIRGSMEKLSGGGTSSGLMSFLEVLDRSAGATKSGGTTRRAAKMVCLDMDHPEIEDFISWKVREEKKVAALVAAGYPADYEGDAYRTVSGQNSNNSVRITDGFMQAVVRDGEWTTTARTDGKPVKVYRARDLWRQVAKAAWSCADPGVQFDDHIQKWHTCPQSGRINGSNPCSEYMFLDDSACNLASVNICKFWRESGAFDLQGYLHTCRILFIAQEILIDFSSYPTSEIARNSHRFRPLGLGFANLGTYLMVQGLPYDSSEGLGIAAALTALMTGQAYLTSAEMAASKGPFSGFAANRDPMLRVIRQHRKSLDSIETDQIPDEWMDRSRQIWDEVIQQGERVGFRNAQATVLAPTGTIGLLMDCDTTGIEPDFALVKVKKLAGGGFFKLVNQSVPKALRNLRYTEKQVAEIVGYAVGTMSLEHSPHINRESLLKCGLNEKDLENITAALPSAVDLRSAFQPWVLGEATMRRLAGGHAIAEASLLQKGLLAGLGFSQDAIKEASRVICGRLTLEGAPHLKAEHLPVFDCANICGPEGRRSIQPLAHLRMMAAVQPFLSGAISKTVNVPHATSVEEIEDLFVQAWNMRLKAVAIYRDGSKLSQPLTSSSAPEIPSPASDQRKFDQKELEAAIARAVALAPARKQKMPPRRSGLTIEARVGGQKIFLRTGEYVDGRLGEIFIDMQKEGATLRSLLNCFAMAISVGLQYGVPLEDFVERFVFTRFEPYGLVDHPNIKQATSLVDYIFRVLGMEYLGKTDFVHVPPIAEVAPSSGEQKTVQETGNVNAQMTLDLQKAALPEAAPPNASLAAPTANPESEFHDPLDQQLAKLASDSPLCNVCGHVTVRNGSCYRCLNCGQSLGCS